MLGPSRTSSGGPTRVATRTLSTTTIARVAGQRGEQRPGHDEERDEHREQQRAAGEDRRAAGGAPGRPGGVEGVGAGGQLLAEAGDHQQRVVDPQRQAHHRADGEREGVDAEPVGEDREQAARGEDRERRRSRAGSRPRSASGRRAGGRSAGSAGRSARPARVAAIDSSWIASRDRGEARLGGAHRRVDLLFEGAFELGDRFVDRLVDADVEVGEDQGAAGARAEPPDRAAVPGREGGDLRVSRRSARISAGPWRSMRRGRPAQEDREGAPSPKCSAQHPVGARGGGAGDVERGRAEPAVRARCRRRRARR